MVSRATLFILFSASFCSFTLFPSLSLRQPALFKYCPEHCAWPLLTKLQYLWRPWLYKITLPNSAGTIDLTFGYSLHVSLNTALRMENEGISRLFKGESLLCGKGEATSPCRKPPSQTNNNKLICWI